MILITGGTGLLGSHLLFKLISSGNNVRVLIRESSKKNLISKIFINSSDKNLFDKIEWVIGDILDICSLENAMKGIDEVYHCAAIVSFDPSKRNEMMKINIEGTANVANIAKKNSVRKFCYVSSIASLGRANANGLIDENTKWKDSQNNSYYSISKYKGEREIWRAIAEGLNCTIVNPGVIIGPGDWHNDSSKLIKTSWDGLKFYTNGINGYVDVRDVANIMIELMNNNIFNQRYVITSENISYKTFFDSVAESLNIKKPSYHAGPFLSGIAWRVEKIIGMISGKFPLITRETARTANKTYKYDNKKIIKELDYSFIPMKQSVIDTCEIFLRELSLKK